METFICRIAQNGFYAGPVHFIYSIEKTETKQAADPEAELRRLQQGVAYLSESMRDEKQKDADETEREIRGTVLSILGDPAFLAEAEAAIRDDGLTAEAAAAQSAQSLSEAFEKLQSAYIGARGEDIQSAAQQLIAVLSGDGAVPESLCALCARQIGPAQLLSVDKTVLGGILTEKGSANSHVSILAGSLGIPYLYGNGEAVQAAERGTFIILDAEKGEVIIDPEEEIKKAALERMEECRRKKEERTAHENHGKCREGEQKEEREELGVCRTKVYANIAGPQDIPSLHSSGADGVGLFRTEFLFLNKDTPPTEEEQFEAYKAVLEAMEGKEVTIRTMDLGSDKKASWLSFLEEINPALGLRGLRVCLTHKDLFRTQLRALLRAAVYGNMKVMFPMIASEWEMDEIFAMVEETERGLQKEGVQFAHPALGIMVETPAAAVCAGTLAKKAQFFSIGTNDLIQYTLAIDRETVGLEQYFNPHHQAVFDLIKMTVNGGHRQRIPVGVCGQLAADPKEIGRLIELGVDELSVPVGRVKEVKKQVLQEEKVLKVQNVEKETSGYRFAEDAACSNEQGEPDISVTTATDGELTAASEASVAAAFSDLAAAADGELIPMEEIPDPAFSGGSLGDCYGILPENGKVYAPVSGVISHIANTAHAVTIDSTDGRAVLVHVGINTVDLDGKPFRLHVQEGNRVQQDQLLLEADLEEIRKAGCSTMIIVAVLPQ